MTFDDALKLLVSGHQITISTWDKNKYLIIDKGEILKSDGVLTKSWVPSNEDILSTNWKSHDWGTYYDKGFDEGYKVGYDEAIEKYLETVEAGGRNLKTINYKEEKK